MKYLSSKKKTRCINSHHFLSLRELNTFFVCYVVIILLTICESQTFSIIYRLSTSISAVHSICNSKFKKERYEIFHQIWIRSSTLNSTKKITEPIENVFRNLKSEKKIFGDYNMDKHKYKWTLHIAHPFDYYSKLRSHKLMTKVKSKCYYAK